MRIIHVSEPNASGPSIYPVNVGIPAESCTELEAWMSNFGGCNVHILEGEPSLKQAEEILKASGQKDPELLMTLTGSGPVKIPMELSSQKISVFFEGKNESGQAQVVCLKIR